MRLEPMIRHHGPEMDEVLGSIRAFLTAFVTKDQPATLASLAPGVHITDDAPRHIGFGKRDAARWLRGRWKVDNLDDYDGVAWVGGELRPDTNSASMLVMFNCRRSADRKTAFIDGEAMLALRRKRTGWVIYEIHWLSGRREVSRHPTVH